MADRSRTKTEDGGVLVMVVFWLPVLLLFTVFAIDVGNWFEHRRHLQMQADAAALAAAGDFRIPCTDGPINTAAMVYSGFTAPAYNQQVAGGQTRTHIVINSPTYYNQASPVDSTVVTGPPCSARMVDVKLTETDLPWYFGFGKVVSFINAHARVEIKPLQTTAGALPVGVPDVNPKAGKVVLYNEDTGAPITSQPLHVDGGIGSSLVQWDNVGVPLNFTVPAPPAGQGSAHIGVRIVLSGNPADTTCGDPLVDCYELGTQNSLLFIQGYSTAGSGAQPNAPMVRDVVLRANSCTDGYFVMASCSVNMRAKIDTGSLATSNATMKVTGAGCPNNGCNLTFQATGADAGYWTGAIPVAAASGQNPLTLNWAETSGSITGLGTCKNGGSNPCTGSFGVVQRVYAGASNLTGPIQVAQVGEGATTAGVDSLQSGTQHSLVVRIGITGSLQYASSASDPIVYLRVNGNSNGNSNASQNQSLDCDPAVPNLATEIAQGCQPQYAVNTGSTCPNSAPALWGSAQPWACVALQTGSATNDPAKGLNTRVLGSPSANTCPGPGQLGHNNWSMFPNLPAGDPRIVDVFLTPFGSFDGSGSGTVPVTQFATFYVTGWTAQGGGFANPCQGNGDDPIPGGDPGVIAGHFIKYVQTLNTGGGGPGFCDLSGGSLNSGTCVAVLTQ
jgi:Flp pilus assembly protein TadG